MMNQHENSGEGDIAISRKIWKDFMERFSSWYIGNIQEIFAMK